MPDIQDQGWTDWIRLDWTGLEWAEMDWDVGQIGRASVAHSGPGSIDDPLLDPAGQRVWTQSDCVT